MGDSLTNNFCRTNDERKCQDSVKFQKKYDYVLVDRGYASTLIYNYIQFQSKTPNEYLTTINWYMNGITNGKLIKPDLYIYLKLDPKSSIARAKLLKRHSTKYAWFTHPNLGIKAYDFFFKFLEPDVPRIIVNGNISTEEQVNIINQEFVKYEFIK